LRRERLYSSLISEWGKQRDRGGLSALARPSGRPATDPLERENARLREHDEVRERRRQATHPAHTKPELIATKPNEVYGRSPFRTTAISACFWEF